MNARLTHRLSSLLLFIASVFLVAPPALAQMSATEYKAIYREINQYGYALVSVSVIETYPEETRSLMDSWVENNIDILTEGVLSEEPFDMVDNPLAEYAARLNKALTDAGLSGEAALFADGVVTAVDNISALKLLRASTEVDAKRIALYNIDLNNMNATQGIPLIWPTPLGTAPNSIIGIIDTGVEKTHSLLAGKVISEACFSSSFPLYIDSLCPSGVKALVGNNAGLPCADVATCYHGTYMAGIAAASQKEGAGVNYSGVAKSAKIASAMVFSTYKTERYCGKGKTTCTSSNDIDVRAALNYLYTLQAMFKLIHPNLRLNAVNASISVNETVANYCADHQTGPMVTYLTNAGVPVVASAGNSGMSAINSGIGCNKETITVGAVDASGKTILDVSNRDPKIDLYAVGDKINAPTLGNNYRDDIGGTSASAAAVSGAFAIIKEKNPALPVAELLKMLQDTSYLFKYSHATLGEQEGRRLKLCQDYRFNGRSYECGI